MNRKQDSATRKSVERTVDCDTSRLYGPLDEAIAYLREIRERHPHASLDEHWTGYESMELRFVWFEPETDEEFAARREQEREDAAAAAREKARADARVADTKEYRRLKQKLGL